MLAHNFRSVPIQIVLRSKTQKIIKKEKLYLLMSKTSAGTAFLRQYFGSPNGDNRNWNVWEAVNAFPHRQSLQAEGFAGRSPLDTYDPFKKGSILNFFESQTGKLRKLF